MIHIDVPYGVDGRGRTATSDDARHLRNLIEVLLFTNPGERVNRPDFGGGIRAMLFNVNSLELAAALKFNLQANLQRWLGDLIDVRELTVSPDDSTLVVELRYAMRRTGEERTERFRRQV